MPVSRIWLLSCSLFGTVILLNFLLLINLPPQKQKGPLGPFCFFVV